MRVIAVTGMMAERTVKRYASMIKLDIDVLVLPISVAAFITPEYAAECLKKEDLHGYDMILMPGAVLGDVSLIEKATGVPTFKGPIHAADLAISFMEGLKLSKVLPASDFAKNLIRERAEAEIKKIKEKWHELYVEHGGLIIGSRNNQIPIGSSFPMPVVAEIVNAPQRGLDEIGKLAKYYASEGAEIIDIGMLAGTPMPAKIEKIVDTLRNSVNLPLSIDTLNEDEIKAAANSGIDLVLSLDAGNIDEVSNEVIDTPVVVLPSNMKKGELAKDPVKRVDDLEKNIERAKDLGLKKIIADPVLEPAFQPGLMNSLRAYQLFRERNHETPMLFGLGNVTELIDVDSIGVNGLLTALAYEVGANMLFTPEFSVKVKGSVRELATASKMMFLARNKTTVPKDLGIDLLVLKEKRWVEEPYAEHEVPKARIIKSIEEVDFTPDKTGWFKIQIDRDNKMIEALFYHNNEEKPSAIVKGKEVTEIYQTIIRERMVEKLDHAAYLGKELGKAELALKLGRAYVQDEDLF